MRLGASLFFNNPDPEKIALSWREAGYNAAICPEVSLHQREKIRAIQQAFTRQDVILAEIGVWNNMLDPNKKIRRRNLAENVRCLAIAEAVGVRCCVNIAGSFNPHSWHGPHPKDLSPEAFEQTVDNIRHVIDEVQPTRAYYAIESMPWGIPNSPEAYLRLLKAVDRPMFAVHLDPVNMINCPSRYFNNAEFLKECFKLLGKWIVSIHAKDIQLKNTLTLHLEEKPPGLGSLDYRIFLQEAAKLSKDTPLIIEHLPEEAYPRARQFILSAAQNAGVGFDNLPHGTQTE
jgi:sugar phosphate isomerase/epimerase